MPLLGSVSGWGWGLGSQEKGKDHFRAPGLYLLSQIIQSSLHWFNSIIHESVDELFHAY